MLTKLSNTEGLDLETYSRLPIFVTGPQVTAEIVEDFLTTARSQTEWDEETAPKPSLITTTSFVDALRPFTDNEIRPFLNRGSPFMSWTPMQVFKFFVQNCGPVEYCLEESDEASSQEQGQHTPTAKKYDPWPTCTFVLLDDLSAKDTSSPFHRTATLCTALPDFHEYEKNYLKTTRVPFASTISDFGCVDIMVRCISETGKEITLSQMPPAIVGGASVRREVMSFGAENSEPWTKEHLSRQVGERGFESEEITWE